ncbi:MAG: hypothetical protein HZA53_14390 [Planctomycetes bacterium]|nr:hypothetical protein [Planctomycetota bacterium]
MDTSLTDEDKHMLEETFRRIAGDLGMIADRTIEVGTVAVELASARAAGRSAIHVSFKFGLQYQGQIHHGTLLVPLPDAITLGCYLMMVPDDGVKSKRALTTLDPGLKDALMEVGNFIGGATDAALRGLGIEGLKVRSEGCQGVKANVRPALSYVEGTPLLIGRSKLRIHTWNPFEAILMLPRLTPAAASSPS